MRTCYCSYCCLWSQRDFCNRLERSRTWEPFILLSFPAWEFISSKIVTSGFVSMGKSIWGRNRGWCFLLHQGVWGVGQSWKLQCSLNLPHYRCFYVSVLVQITSMLLKQICWSFPLTPLRCAMCFMQSLGNAGTELLPDETCPGCSL